MGEQSSLNPTRPNNGNGAHASPLTPRQERFALNLFMGMSQRLAYLAAGYSPNQSPTTIDIHASQLAASDKVMIRLQELQEAAANERIMSVQERLERLSEIGRARMTDFISEDGDITLEANNNAAISEYSVDMVQLGEDAVVHKKKIKLINPVSAMQEINKMQRIYSDGTNIYNDNRKVEINGLTDDQLERLITDNATAGG